MKIVITGKEGIDFARKKVEDREYLEETMRRNVRERLKLRMSDEVEVINEYITEATSDPVYPGFVETDEVPIPDLGDMPYLEEP